MCIFRREGVGGRPKQEGGWREGVKGRLDDQSAGSTPTKQSLQPPTRPQLLLLHTAGFFLHQGSEQGRGSVCQWGDQWWWCEGRLVSGRLLRCLPRCAKPCQMWPDSAPWSGCGSNVEKVEMVEMVDNLLNFHPDLPTSYHSHQGPRLHMLRPTAPPPREIPITALSAPPGTAPSPRSMCCWPWYAGACRWCWGPSSWPSTSPWRPPPPPSTTSRPSPLTSLPLRYEHPTNTLHPIVLFQPPLKVRFHLYLLFWEGNAASMLVDCSHLN